jgi:hypothetical protein
MRIGIRVRTEARMKVRMRIRVKMRMEVEWVPSIYLAVIGPCPGPGLEYLSTSITCKIGLEQTHKLELGEQGFGLGT